MQVAKAIHVAEDHSTYEFMGYTLQRNVVRSRNVWRIFDESGVVVSDDMKIERRFSRKEDAMKFIQDHLKQENEMSDLLEAQPQSIASFEQDGIVYHRLIFANGADLEKYFFENLANTGAKSKVVGNNLIWWELPKPQESKWSIVIDWLGAAALFGGFLMLIVAWGMMG